MTDKQFFLEIEDYTKVLKEDDSHAEDKEVQDFIEDDLDLEIGHIRLVEDLKEELDTRKTKVQSLNDIIINKTNINKYLEENMIKGKTDKRKNQIIQLLDI